MIVKTVMNVFLDEKEGEYKKPTTLITVRFFGVLIFKKIILHPEYRTQGSFVLWFFEPKSQCYASHVLRSTSVSGNNGLFHLLDLPAVS